MSDDRPPTEIDFDHEIPGIERLIEKGEVTIKLEIKLELDTYLTFEEGRFVKNQGDFQLSSSMESKPYNVAEVLGSQAEVCRFLAMYFQMVAEEGGIEDDK